MLAKDPLFSWSGSSTLEYLRGHFDLDIFSVILQLSREILLINSALKHKQGGCNVRSHFTLQSLSLNNAASLNYSQHRVPANVNISNHQPSKKEI